MWAEEELIVLCVDIDKIHTSESIKGNCSKCNKLVWVSPWHKEKQLICVDCFSKIQNKDIKIGITEKDLKRSIDFFKEEKDV